MILKLTDEIRDALEKEPGKPLQVEDEQTHRAYVLISADQYQRFRALFDPTDAFDIRETYAAQDAVARAAGWDDPALDVYNYYDANKPRE